MPRIKERVIEVGLAAAAVVTILTTIGIIWVLLSQTIEFFSDVSLGDFLTDTQWTPLFADKHFGILPLVAGTFLTTFIAILVALPIGLTIAVYLNEYAPKKIKQSITGNGNATKEQVSRMLQHILKFQHDSKFLDATDGLAAAYCHYMQKNLGIATAKTKAKIPAKKKATSWDSFVSNNPSKIKK